MIPTRISQPSGEATQLQGTSISLNPDSRSLVRFYSRLLAATRSEKESECIARAWEQHRILGRPPAMSELRQSLRGTPLAELSKDRLYQIISNVNHRLKAGEKQLVLTIDRPFFRFRADVKALGLEWFERNRHCPKRSEWVAALEQRGFKVSHTTLDNILRDLRRRCPKAQRAAFRFSCRRINTSWGDIAFAAAKGKNTLRLVRTMRSGLYDADLRRVMQLCRGRFGRSPTFSELLWAVRSSHPKVKIRIDSLQRRCSKLGFKLTAENELKEKRQQTVATVIRELRQSLGRKPITREVLARLRKRDAAMTERLLFKTLNTAKRRRFLVSKQSLLLGSPGQTLGALSKAIRAQREQHPKVLPTTSQLAERLSWKEEGITSLISPLQEWRAAHRHPTLAIAGSPLERALRLIAESVKSATQGAFIVPNSIDTIGVGQKLDSQSVHPISQMLQGWELPELPNAKSGEQLKADDVLRRAAIHWIHLVCMHAPFRQVEERLEDEARLEEFLLARKFGFESAEKSPFHGMIHALKVSQLARRRTEDEIDYLLARVRRQGNVGVVVDLLAEEIECLGEECGFRGLKSGHKEKAAHQRI